MRFHDKEAFHNQTPDDEIMSVVGPKGWIIVSQDWKWHIIEAELAAVKQHKAKCLYLPGSGADRWTTYCRFIRSHKNIIRRCGAETAPFILDLKANGQLKKIEL